MQRVALVLASGLLVGLPAWAHPPAQMASNPAAPQLNQRIAQHQAEVEHLEQDVGQQESASQQAAQRLQQQDRTISELRQQLKAAQDVKPPGAHSG